MTTNPIPYVRDDNEEKYNRYIGIVHIAADFPECLRESDVDRIMSELQPEEVEDFKHWLTSFSLRDTTYGEIQTWKA